MTVMKAIERAILKTLVYASIFSYPLRPEEICRYLVIDNPVDSEVVFRALKMMEADGNPVEPCRSPSGTIRTRLTGRFHGAGRIQAEEGYYFLSGQGEIVGLRKKREKWSQEKVRKAKKVAKLLRLILTVKLVGISGGLAMNNADENDDIDLFIVTAGGRLWLTRLLVTALVELMGKRRQPFPKYKIHNTKYIIQDLICLNMFVDEDHLAIPLSERNLYTAHEVAQMKMLWDRDGMYQRFLVANSWVGDYLPNTLPAILNEAPVILNEVKNLRDPSSASQRIQDDKVGQIGKFMNWFEKALRVLQLKYMSRRRTTEKISPGRILFHPEEKGEWVMREWEKRCWKLGL